MRLYQFLNYKSAFYINLNYFLALFFYYNLIFLVDFLKYLNN